MCCFLTFSRTTSMWMRRHVSLWRISWPMTKACPTRRAMENGSNWTWQLWPLRASRAAANGQHIYTKHSPHPGMAHPLEPQSLWSHPSVGVWRVGHECHNLHPSTVKHIYCEHCKCPYASVPPVFQSRPRMGV